MARHRSPTRLTPRQHLKLFVTRVEELGRSTLIRRNGLTSSWSFSYNKDQPITCRSIEPDRDLFASYLLDFRKFISEGEPIFIGYIFGLCHEHLTNDEFKGAIRHCQQGWRNAVEENGVTLIVDGKQITPEHLADLWINGQYFHNDPAKLSELKRYVNKSFLFARHEFIAFIVTATAVIGRAGTIVRIALRDGALNV